MQLRGIIRKEIQKTRHTLIESEKFSYPILPNFGNDKIIELKQAMPEFESTYLQLEKLNDDLNQLNFLLLRSSVVETIEYPAGKKMIIKYAVDTNKNIREYVSKFESLAFVPSIKFNQYSSNGISTMEKTNYDPEFVKAELELNTQKAEKISSLIEESNAKCVIDVSFANEYMEF